MKLLIAIAAAGLAAATANAQTYDFSYQFSATGNTISGEFAGFITGDTFYFTGLNWFKVNGVTMTDATYFDSTDNFYGFAPGSPSAKLDGSYLDFAIADAPYRLGEQSRDPGSRRLYSDRLCWGRYCRGDEHVRR